ncbi:hypothetical protein DL771_000831 [Monosporascus sp. 5C6A]|nr:hypothetical protein DL771_000831 [Monosporascus sp. 5C6A]
MLFSLYLAYFIVGYVGLVLSFYMLTPFSNKAAFVARTLAAYLSLIICAIYGIFAVVVLRILGKQQSSQWAAGRAFKYVMGMTTGVKFEVHDPKGILDTVRPAVFIGNHQTELDLLMLGCMFPKYCSVTAKKSLKNIPFLGQFITLSGTVLIDRQNSKDARAAMAGAATLMTTRKQSVYMFPEGTRSYAEEPELLPFKKGAFHLAVQAQVPIVPVVVANYSHILNFKKWIFKAGTVPIKGTLQLQKIPESGAALIFIPVLDPIYTVGLKAEDVDELTRSTRELFQKEYVELTRQVQKRPIAMPASKGEDGVVHASGADATLSR